MHQDCLLACGRTQPANALNPGISQQLEAGVGGSLEKTGRKAEVSSDLIILGFWENSFYSSYTQLDDLCKRSTLKFLMVIPKFL